MMLSLDKWVGKTAIVTGASSGIGAEIAEKLVAAGMKVAALARRKELLDELAQKLENKKGKLYPIQADLSKEEDILKAFDFIKENLGPVHVLVNNAATLIADTLCDGDAENWRKMFDINVIGLCIATREALKNMKANHVDGQIIHINSIVGKKVLDVHGMAGYISSKYAVTALAESLRYELINQKSKIKVTSICPGAVATQLLDPLRPDNVGTFDMMDTGKLMLQPADVADAVLFVLSTPPHVLVVALARRKNLLDVLAQKLANKKGQLHPIQADMSKEEDILKAFEFAKKNLGRVHVLVNNAALLKASGGLGEGKTSEWEDILRVNVLGLSIATREAVRDMKENGVNGHIIHINSIGGHRIYNFKGMEMYGPSKFAVTALTEMLRLELANQASKIKVTSISPGSVDTKMLQDVFEANVEQKVFREQEEVPPMLLPEDIADGVIYVLSTPPHVQVHELMIRPVGESI